MRQVFIIHGGNSFSSHEAYLANLKQSPINYDRLKPKPRWTSWVAEQMTSADVLTPSLPNKDNAMYDEWKIYFEKLIPFFGQDVTLVGHSLGAMFLTKYLNQTPLPEKVQRIYLLAPGYDNNEMEDLGSFQVTSASGLTNSSDDIRLFHSQDDMVVPFSELAKFQRDLPAAKSYVFESHGHFLDETFPELLDALQSDSPSA